MTWSTVETDLLRAHYPHVGLQQLTRLLPGRTGRAINRHANVLGLHKATAPREPLILQLAARFNGVGGSELGIARKAGSQVLGRMAAAGQLYRLAMGPKDVRYFLDAKGAEPYRLSKGPQPTVTIRHRTHRAWWPKDTEPYYPPGLKVTTCPSPTFGLRTGWGCGINPNMWG